MLTAAVAERIHHQKRPAVVHPRVMVQTVADGQVRGCQIPQRPEIRHHRRRIHIQGRLFTVIRPERIPRNAHHHLIRKHLLRNPAGLDALAGVIIPGPAVLIAPEHPSGHLAVPLSHLPKILVSKLQIFRAAAEQIINSRLPKALGDVHIVPVGQIICHPPVSRAAMNFLRQFKQPGFSRPIVQPVHTEKIFSAPHPLPVAG